MEREEIPLQISVRDWGRVRTLLRRCAVEFEVAADETKQAVQVLFQDKMGALVSVSTVQGGEGECIVVIQPSRLLEELPEIIKSGAVSDLRREGGWLSVEHERLARHIVQELRGDQEVSA
jgi:hypothetical protein